MLCKASIVKSQAVVSFEVITITDLLFVLKENISIGLHWYMIMKKTRSDVKRLTEVTF